MSISGTSGVPVGNLPTRIIGPFAGKWNPLLRLLRLASFSTADVLGKHASAGFDCAGDPTEDAGAKYGALLHPDHHPPRAPQTLRHAAVATLVGLNLVAEESLN